MLSLEAMGIGAGDEVICPSFTFYATSEAIARVGATPVFADIDPVSLNLDPEDVAARITPQTKAIMPVHLFGRPAPLDELAALGLPLIEDAAQAFGAAGVARPASARRSASSRRRTSSPSATAGSSPAATTLSRTGCGCCAFTARATREVRARRHQLAARRGSGGHAARVLPHLAGWNAGRRAGAASTQSSGSARSSRSPSTSRGTSTTCTSSARPTADRLAPRSPRRASPPRRTT